MFSAASRKCSCSHFELCLPIGSTYFNVNVNLKQIVLQNMCTSVLVWHDALCSPLWFHQSCDVAPVCHYSIQILVFILLSAPWFSWHTWSFPVHLLTYLCPIFHPHSARLSRLHPPELSSLCFACLTLPCRFLSLPVLSAFLVVTLTCLLSPESLHRHKWTVWVMPGWLAR